MPTRTALVAAAALAPTVRTVIDVVNAAEPLLVGLVDVVAGRLHIDDTGTLEIGDRWSLGAVVDGPGVWTLGAWGGATDRAVAGHTHEARLALGRVVLFVEYDGEQGNDEDDVAAFLAREHAGSGCPCGDGSDGLTCPGPDGRPLCDDDHRLGDGLVARVGASGEMCS